MPSTRPNILVFIMDDQTPNAIRALGNHHISTPVLDELVFNGVYLSPYTTVPVCTPGRAEFLTGRNAFRNGCRWFGEPIDGDIETLPKFLRRQGYHTCHIGKWHNDGHPRDRGFDETHMVFCDDLIGDYAGHAVTFEENGRIVKGHSTEVFCNSAINFLQSSPQNKPWFCYVALHSPHDPRTAPEPWASMYTGNNQPPLPPNFMPEHPFDNGDMMIRDERLAGFPRRQDEIRRHRGDYYSMISHHDHHIGLVLEKLRRIGQYDNTLIVFTSDHGLACGGHGLMGKENLYEHSVRVPLIISGPGIPKGKRLDKTCVCGHYDFIPTLAEYLGITPPDTAEGISYLDAIHGKKETIRKNICAAYRECMRMATDGRFKLIYYPHIDRTQLFDLDNDLDETNDLMLPWRRYPESRCLAPTMSPGNTTYDPDPEPDRQNRQLGDLLYVPAMPASAASAAVAALRVILRQWQEEMADPIRN